MAVVDARKVNREQIERLLAREEKAYRDRTPKSAKLHERARESLPMGVASSFQELGDRLTRGTQEVIDEFGLPGYAINVGPKGCVMFTPARVTNYRDLVGLDTDLWTAFFFYLANRGILLPPGPDDQWTLSVQHTQDEVDRHVATFRDFARELTGGRAA